MYNFINQPFKQVTQPKPLKLHRTNPTLIEEIVNCRQELLFKAYKRTKSVCDAEDLTHNTLEAALKNLDHYEPEKSTVSAWLFGILQKLWICQARNNRRRENLFIAFTIESYNGVEEIIYNTALDNLEKEEVKVSMLKLLKPIAQEIIEMRVEGYTFKEIGAYLDMTPQEAHRSYNASVNKLKNQFAKDEEVSYLRIVR